MSAAWITAPMAAYAAGKPFCKKAYTPTEEETQFLEQLACETWEFFKTYCTPQEHGLPPDNVQILPATGVAHRTSPTNIGLMATAICTARRMGFVTLGQKCSARLEAMFNALEHMEQWRGHFLNWYDTRTLAPLKTPVCLCRGQRQSSGIPTDLRQDRRGWRSGRPSSPPGRPRVSTIR